MSEAAARERIRKQGWAAPGGAHDWLIRLLKIALPVAIGLLAAYLAIVPLRKDRDISFILDKNKVEVAKERMRVSSARYRGQDNEGRAFSIDARDAVQATSDVPIVNIRDMSARLDLENGPAMLTADRARYDLDAEQVQVVGPIQFNAADGYRMETSDVAVDLNTRKLVGEGRVEGVIPLGRFSADRLEADLGNRSVVLSGRARLTINQGMGRR
jgi:lipopolysaccharide export system protein LptC